MFKLLPCVWTVAIHAMVGILPQFAGGNGGTIPIGGTGVTGGKIGGTMPIGGTGVTGGGHWHTGGKTPIGGTGITTGGGIIPIGGTGVTIGGGGITIGGCGISGPVCPSQMHKNCADAQPLCPL
ncbi:MAG: hypothetical protein FWE38_01595 [Firmicutes bacterium]|nr:hypothetical protein [Bacillota bacterium]